MYKKYSGLGPMPDEAMVSFIYRVLQRNGYNNFYTIMTSGGWGSEPSVPFPARSEFSSFEQKCLLKLYEKTFQSKSDSSVFSSPIGHLKHFDQVFNPIKHVRTCGQEIPIRYCGKCIAEQLKCLGFYYFRHRWLTDTICSKHNVELSVIPPHVSKLKVSELIRKTLSGRTISCSPDNQHLSTPNLDAYTQVKFAPCVQLLLAKYLYKKKIFFLAGYIEIADYGLLTSHQRIAVNNKNSLQNAYLSIDSYIDPLLSSFYNETMELLCSHVDISFFSLRNMSKSNAYIGKIQGSNCTLCRLTPLGLINECPVFEQLLIYREKSKVRKSQASGYNLCDQWIHETNKSIKMHQQALGVDDGEKRTNREVHCSKFSARFGRTIPKD